MTVKQIAVIGIPTLSRRNVSVRTSIPLLSGTVGVTHYLFSVPLKSGAEGSSDFPLRHNFADVDGAIAQRKTANIILCQT